MPSVCYFERADLIPCAYVDDLTFAQGGLRCTQHSARLSKSVDLEPFAPLTRVLGRTRRPVWFEDKPALSLDTSDFPGNVLNFMFPWLVVTSNLRQRHIGMKVLSLSVMMSHAASLHRQQHAP